MTLDKAIRHTEEVAEIKERQVKRGEWKKGSLTEQECIKSAAEHRQLAEWLKELKRYREQRPYEDCISRQAAIEAMGEQPLNWTNSSREIAEEMMWEEHIKALKELSPVTPARPKGKWLKARPFEFQMHDYECSECLCGVNIKTEYCPGCGAIMDGVLTV